MRRYISRAFWGKLAVSLALTLVGAVSAADLTPAEQAEVRDLEKKIGDLEGRYATYYKKYQQLKKRNDQMDAQVANLPSMVQGRLTPISGSPVPTGNRAAYSTLYYTPYRGNYATVYYRNAWRLMRFSEISLALTGTAANSTYDVFLYRASLGVLTLELSAAWANLHTRTDALTKLDGVYVKNSDNTRRYIGTFRTVAANQYDDTDATRGLWNYYNRVKSVMRRYDNNNTWTYNNNAWREAQGDTANDGNYVIGINEVLVTTLVKTNTVSNNNSVRTFTVGVGVNTVGQNAAQLLGAFGNPNANPATQIWAIYKGYPGIGYNTNAWIEYAPGGNAVLTWGDNGNDVATRSGATTYIEN